MLYRILTEDKNILSIRTIVSGKFKSFTMIQALGCYEGQKEDTLIIEIDTLGLHEKEAYAKVEEITNQISILNQQESVLVQQISVDSWLHKGVVKE